MNQNKKHHNHPKTIKHAKYLRQEQTPAEQKLWSILRNRHLDDYKFRRQQPIGKYIVDFYCSQANLVIEIDGDSHTEQEEYDHLRTKWLEDQGYKVVRFMNSDVHDNLEGIAIQILRICQGEDKL